MLEAKVDVWHLQVHLPMLERYLVKHREKRRKPLIELNQQLFSTMIEETGFLKMQCDKIKVTQIQKCHGKQLNSL